MEHGILYPCKIPGYGQRRMRYHCRCPLQLDMLPVGHLYLDGAPISTWAIVSVFEHVGFAKVVLVEGAAGFTVGGLPLRSTHQRAASSLTIDLEGSEGNRRCPQAGNPLNRSKQRWLRT